MLIIYLMLLVFINNAYAETETAVAPPVEMVDAFAASMRTTIKKGEYLSVTEIGFLKYNNILRYNRKDEEAHDGEYILFDLNKMKKFRVLPDQKMFFESAIENKFLTTTARRGEIPFQSSPNIAVSKINLGKAVLNEVDCNLVLVIRILTKPEEKDLKAYEYTLMWEAPSLENYPLQSLFTYVDNTKVVVEFLSPSIQAMPANTFIPPQDYMNLSPY